MKNAALLFIGIASLTTACQGEAVYSDPDPHETDGKDGNAGGDEGFAAIGSVSGSISSNNGATSVTTGALNDTGGTTTGGVNAAGGAAGDAVSASGAVTPGNNTDLDPNCAAEVAGCYDALPNELFTEEKCRAMQYACRGLKEVCVTQFLFDEATPSDQELCDAAAGDHEQTRHSYGLDSTGTHITCCWLEPE